MVAFLDRNPAVRGHTLVVPTEHRESLFAPADATPTAVFEAASDVATALDETLGIDGVSVFYTTGDLVGQVTHAHVNLLPRRIDDDITIALARDSLDDEAATRLAASVRESV